MRAVDLGLLVVLLAAALAWPLAAPPIGTHGEAREGLVVQDVVREGRWILPRRNGELPSKPPLYHWVAAGIVRLGFVSDAGVRMPSALAALGMAAAVLALGTAAGGRAVGWLGVGAVCGMQGFWEAASEARVDMLFAALVTASLAAFAHWDRTEAPWARTACWLAAALAVLAKGPAGVVLPGLVVAVYLVADRRPARLRALWSWPLVAAVLVLDLGWYALATLDGGRAFLELQLVRENVHRAVGRGPFGLHGGRGRFHLVGRLFTDLLPWSLVVPVAAWRRVRGEREDALGRFLHAWWLVVLGVFTAAYGKRGVYLLPLYPAIALLAGRALARALAPDGALAALPVPAAVRRRFPARPALALVAIAIVVLDVGLAVGTQTVRVLRAGRRSLVPFAAAVARALPPGAALEAAASVSDTDRQVLAYRLARPIPRAVASAGAIACGEERHVLVGLPQARELAAIGWTMLAASARRGENVALVRAPPPAACADGGTAPP